MDYKETPSDNKLSLVKQTNIQNFNTTKYVSLYTDMLYYFRRIYRYYYKYSYIYIYMYIHKHTYIQKGLACLAHFENLHKCTLGTGYLVVER